MFFPVGGNFGIYDTAHLVEYRLRVAIRSGRAEHRLPYVVLAARPGFVAGHQFHVVFVALRGEYFT